MAKRKFNAAKWLDEFDAIQHIYIYVARTEGMADQIGSGFRIWTGHSEDGTPAEMEEAARRYHELLDQMKAAPGGGDAVEAELLKRGRVIRFKGAAA